MAKTIIIADDDLMDSTFLSTSLIISTIGCMSTLSMCFSMYWLFCFRDSISLLMLDISRFST